MLKVNGAAKGVTAALNTGTSFTGNQEEDVAEEEEGRQDGNEANIRGELERKNIIKA